MRNPHGVEPTQFMKRKKSSSAINCYPGCGPRFGSGADIGIRDNCNEKGGYTYYGNGDGSYECNSPLKCSLFVGTAKPDESNSFKVSDYEVFTYE